MLEKISSCHAARASNSFFPGEPQFRIKVEIANRFVYNQTISFKEISEPSRLF